MNLGHVDIFGLGQPQHKKTAGEKNFSECLKDECIFGDNLH
jgi:hypothetical protein